MVCLLHSSRHFLFLCRQARLGSAHPCPHLFRTAGFLYAALKLVHVHISTAFKCCVCTPPGPLCVWRRDCDGFLYRHDDIISLEFTVSSPSLSRMPIHFPIYFLGDGTSLAQKSLEITQKSGTLSELSYK